LRPPGAASRGVGRSPYRLRVIPSLPPQPATSPLDPPACVASAPAVRAAQQLAQDVLAPQAERVDVERVPRASIDALAAAGLLGLSGPREAGGGEAPAAVTRAVTEAIAGGCGSTWFVATQHALPLAMVAAGREPARSAHLRQLCDGTALAGVAVSHLRRPGDPAVTARRTGGGWLIDGTVGWMTSWGICDVFLLGAQVGDEELLFALLPAHAQAGLRSDPVMRVAAMEAAATTRLHLEALYVPDELVVDVTDRDAWLAADRAKTANLTPAIFGLLRSIVTRLEAWAERTGSSEGGELVHALVAEGADVRSAAYALIDDVPVAERVEDRLALRAHALELVNRSAAALVTAGGGASMGRSHPHQRLAREALFHLVQAQTSPVRAATLGRYRARTP
jgi:alkylation response protein AidB-like acyl-CoA dehydrogenase